MLTKSKFFFNSISLALHWFCKTVTNPATLTWKPSISVWTFKNNLLACHLDLHCSVKKNLYLWYKVIQMSTWHMYKSHTQYQPASKSMLKCFDNCTCTTCDLGKIHNLALSRCSPQDHSVSLIYNTSNSLVFRVADFRPTFHTFSNRLIVLKRFSFKLAAKIRNKDTREREIVLSFSRN